MKAPDKIYIPKEEIEERMPWISQPYTDDTNWDECYIRKDALLDWAMEKRKLYDQTSSIRRVFDMVINKLNSM